MTVQFHHLGMLYRTNEDATRVERFNPANNAWVVTHGLGIRSKALSHLAANKPRPKPTERTS